MITAKIIYDKMQTSDYDSMVEWANKEGQCYPISTSLMAIKIKDCVAIIDIDKWTIAHTISDDSIETIIKDTEGKTVGEVVDKIQKWGFEFQLINAYGRTENGVFVGYYNLMINGQEAKLKEVLMQHQSMVHILCTSTDAMPLGK